MRIGFIHDRLELYPKPAGGKERFVMNLAKQLSLEDSVEKIIILTLSGGFYGGEIKLGNKIIIRKINNSKVYREIFCLYNECDIVNINTCNFVVPLFDEIKAKTVYHLHDIFTGISNEGRHLDKSIINDWSSIVCPSNFSKNYLINYFHYIDFKNKIKTINRGINLRVFKKKESEINPLDFPKFLSQEILKISQADICLIFPHRSNSKKGEEKLILILNELRKKYKNPKIIATFPEIVSRKEYLKIRSKMPPEIIVINWVNEKILSELLNKADLTLVLSTNPESFSQITLESIACGVPVLSTKFGNLSDFQKEFKGIRYTDLEIKSILEEIVATKNYSKSDYKEDLKTIKEKYNLDKIGNEYLRLYSKLKRDNNKLTIDLTKINNPFYLKSPFSYLIDNKLVVAVGVIIKRVTLTNHEIQIYKILNKTYSLDELYKELKISKNQINKSINNLIKLRGIISI